MKAIISFLLLTSTAAFAQTPGIDTLVSPEVQTDRRVTFRIRAPKASEVSLFGDWMMPGSQQALTRDEQGVWSATTGPLEPGLAIYTFTVDGVTTPDPVNPRIKLRARTSASLVDVPGRPPELWEARDVPHGAVEVNWEKSKVTGDTRAYHVYTPPGYAGRSARYPVLYLLHGNNDTASGWTDVGKANFILDNLIDEKKAVPMINRSATDQLLARKNGSLHEIGSIALAVPNSTSVSSANSSASLLGSATSIAAGLTQTEAGTLTLSAGAYAGGMTLSQGTVGGAGGVMVSTVNFAGGILDANNVTQSGALSLTANSTLNLTPSTGGTLTFAAVSGGGVTLTIGGWNGVGGGVGTSDRLLITPAPTANGFFPTFSSPGSIVAK